MALFSAQAKVLEKQVAELTEANLALTAANTESATRFEADQAAILALTGERDYAVSALSGMTSERDTALASLAAMTTERDTALAALLTEQTGREAAISAAVIQRCAGAGIDPIIRDASATAPGEPKAAGGLTGLAKARAVLADRQPTASTPAAKPAAQAAAEAAV